MLHVIQNDKEQYPIEETNPKQSTSPVYRKSAYKNDPNEIRTATLDNAANVSGISDVTNMRLAH